MTARDVAAYLQVSTGWVWKQVRLNNGFPFIRIGERNVRFSKAAVDAWVSQRAVDGSAAQG
jgi:excisionase family DNA binding protein